MKTKTIMQQQNVTSWFTSYLKRIKIPHKVGNRALAEFYLAKPIKLGSGLSDELAKNVLEEIINHYGDKITQLCIKDIRTSVGYKFLNSEEKYVFVKFNWSAKPKNMFR